MSSKTEMLWCTSARLQSTAYFTIYSRSWHGHFSGYQHAFASRTNNLTLLRYFEAVAQHLSFAVSVGLPVSYYFVAADDPWLRKCYTSRYPVSRRSSYIVCRQSWMQQSTWPRYTAALPLCTRASITILPCLCTRVSVHLRRPNWPTLSSLSPISLVDDACVIFFDDLGTCCTIDTPSYHWRPSIPCRGSKNVEQYRRKLRHHEPCRHHLKPDF